MEDLESLMEEVIRKVRIRDTLSAILISSAFVLFGLLMLILLDVIFIGGYLKSTLSIALLFATWALMVSGIYLLTSMPAPKLPSKIVADSSGVIGLLQRKYPGKIYVTRETFKKLPPAVGLRTNLEVIDVDQGEVKKFSKYGEELANAIVAAKKIKAKVVSSERRKLEGVEVIKPEDVKL
ncbi:MAG: hypothetical protein NZ872_04805 [Archaeoglobaceae archaeon]|nr:hypothetical protein [Archaeoglobaceae archaeon]MDW8128520.1 hypothetical protein [Archaeoglobaceae archaeon]